MTSFRYDPALLQRFPAVVGGVIHATGVTNGPTPPDLAAAFDAESIAVCARIGDTPLSELPTLAAWRRIFRGFGVDPTQYRSAAEALLRRLTKQGQLPSISTLVDLANLVSIRHALPVAVFDLRGVVPPLNRCRPHPLLTRTYPHSSNRRRRCRPGSAMPQPASDRLASAPAS